MSNIVRTIGLPCVAGTCGSGPAEAERLKSAAVAKTVEAEAKHTNVIRPVIKKPSKWRWSKG